MKLAAKKEIVFNTHIFKREYNKRMLDKIEEIITTGKEIKYVTTYPKKCIRRYYGKENKTYFVIIIEHNETIEAITSWKKKGR